MAGWSDHHGLRLEPGRIVGAVLSLRFGVGEKVVVVGCHWSGLLLEACGSLLGLEFLLD